MIPRLPRWPQLQAPWPPLSARVGDQQFCSTHRPGPFFKHRHITALETETPDLPSDGPTHLLVPVFTQMDLSFFVYKVGIVPCFKFDHIPFLGCCLSPPPAPSFFLNIKASCHHHF